MQTQVKETQAASTAGAMAGIVVVWFIIAILWGLSGLLAFIWSLMCIGKSGTDTQKIIGILLAMLLGPFYFIYYGLNQSYCR